MSTKADPFLVNVIMNHHSRPKTKIRGLWRLIDGGHDVRIADSAIDVLLVNGERQPWSVLG